MHRSVAHLAAFLGLLVLASTAATAAPTGRAELPTAFERLQPDVVITVGDRFETMATALAATYMNIPLAHTMGGEVSGIIDESIRHAVTKFAHLHFPASQGAADRIVKLGEDPESVHLVGCPRMDLVAEVLENDGNGLSDLFETGVGGSARTLGSTGGAISVATVPPVLKSITRCGNSNSKTSKPSTYAPIEPHSSPVTFSSASLKKSRNGTNTSLVSRP